MIDELELAAGKAVTAYIDGTISVEEWKACFAALQRADSILAAALR